MPHPEETTAFLELPDDLQEPEFDPFMGSGSTGEMALKLGRMFVGYELNPQFCKLSELRLSKIKEVII